MEYSKIICDDADEIFDEILDFANMVFSMEYGCVDFAAAYPKAYGDGRCGLAAHHVIRESGKIRALLDSYPVTLRLGGGDGEKLKAVYIGTAAVHPKSRGKGFLTELMGYAEKDAREQKFALMMVDGGRHRYQPFGYERAGIRYCFFVDGDNMRHCCTETAGEYGFEEVCENSPYLEKMYGLYCQRNVTARDYGDFLPCLKGEKASVYAVFDGAGFAGYVSLSADGDKLLEFELNNVLTLPDVLRALMGEFGCDSLMIAVGADERGKIKVLENMCDYCNMSMSHQIKILDYEVVLSFLLKWKQKYETLAEGEYVIGIRGEKDGEGRRYLISVNGGDIDVSETDREADAMFGALEFVRTMSTNLFYASYRADNAPAGWFPLPFYLPDADAF